MAEKTGLALAVFEALKGGGGGSGVIDVQVNGTSVVTDGVANVPVMGISTLGVAKVDNSYGTGIYQNKIFIVGASDAEIKAGSGFYKPITASNEGRAVFYTLARIAGDTTQKDSANEVGTYTETAKSKIHDMLDAPETVSGSTPTITAKAGVRYICGEVSTLAVTAPASGIIDVVFESGSTPTVLTVTPPSGTMKWAGGFDPTNLDANAVYEIEIMNGVYGKSTKWEL